MKRTVREKNSIIITFVFYFILVVTIVLFFIFNLLNKLDKINVKKIETQSLYTGSVDIEKKWLSYEEFKKLSANTKNNSDKEIIKNISKDFYDENLKNNNNESFESFIKNKATDLNSNENTKLIDDNNKQIINILPTYSENNFKVWTESLTDYKFINYIESIFETFNLTTKWSIGIWNVILLDNYAVSSSIKWETLDSSIYSIPLSINIKWTKSDIVDFLYFIKNVWTIDINNNKISIFRDNWTLSTNWIPKVLAGDKYSKDYNIFEHQIIDIENISMINYIDDSYNARWSKNFINFIKDEEWNENFEIKVNLNFYVKWQPKNEILNFINGIISNFKLINAHVQNLLSVGKTKWIKLLKLKKQQNLLKNLNIKLVNINKELREQKNLESVYKKSIEFNKIISPMCEEFKTVCKFNK